MRYVLIDDVFEGTHLVVTNDDMQANAVLTQYNDPCNFDGMAREIGRDEARRRILEATDEWEDFGGMVYEV